MDRSKQATKSRTGTRPLIEMSKTDSASTANQAHSPTSVSALLDDGTSIPSTNNEGAGHASPCIVPAKQLETPISDHNPPDVSDQVGEQSQGRMLHLFPYTLRAGGIRSRFGGLG